MATIADVLTAESDSAGDRVLALDEYLTDYSMTRDRSVISAGYKIDRYSCKDPWKYAEKKELERYFDHRKSTLPFYDTWVIGQVHDTTWYSKYRIFDSNVGWFFFPNFVSDTNFAQDARDCYVVSLKCPDSADSRSKAFFDKQTAALEDMIKHDGEVSISKTNKTQPSHSLRIRPAPMGGWVLG
jgi:hypothetical protein